MADGLECIKCGYQETVHRHPEYAREGKPPCGSFDSGAGQAGPSGQSPKDACSHYPDCPATYECVQVGGREYDEDTNSFSSSFTEVERTGPCSGRCRVAALEAQRTAPIDHSVWAIFSDGRGGSVLVDIGS